MIDMQSDLWFALLRDQYKGAKCWAGSSISSRISRYMNLKLTFSIVFVRQKIGPYWCSHSVNFNLYQIVKNYGIWKISSFYCFIRLVSPLRYLYRFYHSRATRTWSVYNGMYHNLFRYFKRRFIYTNNISLLQILFKVNMRFFCLSVYYAMLHMFNSSCCCFED